MEETRDVKMEEYTAHITRVATYQTYNTPLAHEYSSFLPHQHQSIFSSHLPKERYTPRGMFMIRSMMRQMTHIMKLLFHASISRPH